MEIIKEYIHWDGTELASRISKKDISPEEALNTAIKRASDLQEYNAIINPMYDTAKELISKGLPEGPFYGVPTLLKDLMAHYKGIPTSSGSNSCKTFIPQEDAEIVRRMKKAGLVIFGKTNTPEFGIKGTTEPTAFGATKNPWNKNHTPGGSSGGSAAATALRIVPFAHGGDGGGSIRIPSSHCGLFGLKPTRGRNPMGPYVGEVCDGAVVEHFLTRSVRDSAALLDSTHGPDLGALFHIAPPKGSFLEGIKKDPNKLKIAYSTRSPLGGEIHPDCIKAIKETVKLLEELGHECGEDEVKFNGSDLAKYFMVQYSAENSHTVSLIQKEKGKAFTNKNIEIETKILSLIGNTFTARDFIAAQAFKHRLAFEYAKFHQKYDLYLTPSTASPAPLLGQHEVSFFEKLLSHMVYSLGAGKLLSASGIVDKVAKENLDKVPFTQMANITGNPSMSVPLYWTSSNLPVGSMFSAATGNEMILFQMAAQLEKARPWGEKLPPSIK